MRTVYNMIHCFIFSQSPGPHGIVLIFPIFQPFFDSAHTAWTLWQLTLLTDWYILCRILEYWRVCELIINFYILFSTRTLGSYIWMIYFYCFGQIWGDGVWDIVLLHICGLYSPRYAFMGLMGCTCIDLTPQIIFSKCICFYIYLSPFIYNIISFAIVLVTFHMAEFTGQCDFFD